jgi:anti-sigma factor RsiW
MRSEEEVAEATIREEMARDRARWDEDMTTARLNREIHELADERDHRQRLARRQVSRAPDRRRVGSTTGDAGWGAAALWTAGGGRRVDWVVGRHGCQQLFV